MRRDDSRFHTQIDSPELQRMALVAALSVLIAGCSMLPEGRGLSRATVQQPARSAVAALPAPPAGRTRQCINQLSKAQVRFTPVPDQTFGAGCSQLGSVRLSTIGLSDVGRNGAELAVSNIGPVRCELAQRFAGWAQFGIARAAEQMLGSPLVKIETMGSYSCRTIAGSAKLSQHAHANAIDIAAFVLADGRRISVKQGWNGSNQERAFLRTIHASACKRFGTVLGPNYNSAHHDHLHVDMSGQGYCR
ncbi:extensin family protein [Blastomonas sp. AAP53]|uniref:extensin family protein n=1 Tax=Blastomonas sp. AAP53 TaxID=1248760 RepID=UPI0002D54E39